MKNETEARDRATRATNRPGRDAHPDVAPGPDADRDAGLETDTDLDADGGAETSPDPGPKVRTGCRRFDITARIVAISGRWAGTDPVSACPTPIEPRSVMASPRRFIAGPSLVHRWFVTDSALSRHEVFMGSASTRQGWTTNPSFDPGRAPGLAALPGLDRLREPPRRFFRSRRVTDPTLPGSSFLSAGRQPALTARIRTHLVPAGTRQTAGLEPQRLPSTKTRALGGRVRTVMVVGGRADFRWRAGGVLLSAWSSGPEDRAGDASPSRPLAPISSDGFPVRAWRPAPRESFPAWPWDCTPPQPDVPGAIDAAGWTADGSRRAGSCEGE